MRSITQRSITKRTLAAVFATTIVLAGCGDESGEAGSDTETTEQAASDGDVVGTVTDVTEGDGVFVLTVEADGETQEVEVSRSAQVTRITEAGGNQRLPLHTFVQGEGFGDDTWSFVERAGEITDIDQAD